MLREVSSPEGTTAVVCASRVCPLRPGWSKLTVFWWTQLWQPSARGWRGHCQELRKQDSVGSGGGHPRTCSKQAGPHLSHGLETGHGITSGRLQTRAHDPSYVGPNKRCVNVHLNVGAVCADAVVMNEAQIILEIVLAAQSCPTATP